MGLDFRALARDHGIPFDEQGNKKGSRGWGQLHCPFCSDGSQGWHMGFHLQRGNFNCWKCGSHSTKEVLTRLLGSEQLARQALATYRTDGPQFRPAPKKIKHRRRKVWTPPGMDTMKKGHRSYLRRRGYDPDVLEEDWDLGGTTHLSDKKWRWRVTFPIYDATGSVVSYGGRAIKKNSIPKYMMADEENIRQPSSHILYGVHRCQETVVIVEGPADVWRMGPGAVAVLGIDWTTDQANILKDYRRRFVMFDPEPIAQKRAMKLANWLGMYDGETEVITGLDCDPGDLPQDEADDIMQQLLS